MAGRDPNRPQLDFPVLVADIIRDLRLAGQVGLLDFSDVVQPVYIVAQRAGALVFTATSPTFTSSGITSAVAINSAALAIVGDTGPLAPGDYDMFASISFSGLTFDGKTELQHRNAANDTTLAILLRVATSDTTHKAHNAFLPLIGYTIGLNERLRFQNGVGLDDGIVSTIVGMQIRPTP